MHENLGQLKWIFKITVGVMIAGFAITAAGIAFAYLNKEEVITSIVVTTSGVLVQLIGATFLVVYKSTMEQAKDYIKVLDRINAGYMSLDLIKKIKRKNGRDQAYAKVASDILLPFISTTEEASRPSDHAQAGAGQNKA
jgi:hypothetical protein